MMTSQQFYQSTQRVHSLRSTPLIVGDQRLGQRVPFVHDVQVFYHGTALETTHTRDISIKGMRVETKCVPITLNAIVYVELTINESDTDHFVRLPARVAHSAGHTLGLRLLGFDKQMFQWVCNIVDAHGEYRFDGIQTVGDLS